MCTLSAKLACCKDSGGPFTQLPETSNRLAENSSGSVVEQFIFFSGGGLNSIIITTISTIKGSLPKGLDKVTGLEAESYIQKSTLQIKHNY